LDTMKARKDHDFLFRDLEATLEARYRAVDFLWKEIDWDLFIVVITGTDRLMHFLWAAYEEEDHPYHQAFLEYFDKVDTFVGQLYDRFLSMAGTKEGKNQFFMLSDHGSVKVKTEVYLNRWLQESGYLRFQAEQPDNIMDIGAGSIAFALDPSRIYINLKGKYPLGVVKEGDYERIRREVKEGLEELTFNDGNRIAKKVYYKEELYNGPNSVRGPDLVVLAHKGYDLKARVNSDVVFGRTDFTGMHSQDDAFFFSGAGVECRSIFDIKNVILKPFMQV